MAYLHIENLYRPAAQKILDFKWVYAMEKIHGTSANVSWKDGIVHLHPGGEKMDRFAAVFGTLLPAVEELEKTFREIHAETPVTIFGEAYGGKCQGMRKTYGENLSFIAFEVRVGDSWLSVPQAEDACRNLGIPFVWYEKVATDVAALDAVRDRPSEQAKRNGILEDRVMEGVVLRPPFEVHLNDGSRLIAKHKRPEFSERGTPQIVDLDPTKRVLLENAEAIADEWVTEMRLTHVLDKLGNPNDFKDIPAVIAAMVEDVCREASGEIVDNKPTRKAISAKACAMFKKRIMTLTSIPEGS